MSIHGGEFVYHRQFIKPKLKASACYTLACQNYFTYFNMTRITDLEQQIRDLINAPRKHLAIFKDPVDYHKLCSCLDVIGDTELAFHAHKKMSDDSPPGSSYIIAYGFLQALFLQQDAVRHLCEALHLQFENDPLLNEIREIRNNAVGHPTKRGHGKGKLFNYISRWSISKSGFELMTVEPNIGSTMNTKVNFRSLLNTQHVQLENVLDALLQALQREEMEHRKQFRDEKLEELFPQTLSYYFQKTHEAAQSAMWEFGTIHVSLINKVFKEFKTALEKRQIACAYPGVEYQLEQLEYPLAQLEEYFAEKGQGRLNTIDAGIFTTFVHNEMLALKEMARELDAEYASELQ